MTTPSKTTTTSSPIKVVFFGSGPVAAASLELLVKNFDIEAVITKPRPPQHKGSVPVVELAEKLGLNTLTAANRGELTELVAGQHFESQVAVLIDFGIIVEQAVIDAFPLGIVNSHFSLLPEWRGADPITFSILSGQEKTGVSLMLLVEKMDEGPLLGQGEFDLPPSITTPQLTRGLVQLSDALLKTILPLWVKGETGQVSQDSEAVIGYDKAPTYSRKLTKEDGRIDWNKPAEQIEREIRAFAEWPKSYTELAGLPVVITTAHTDTKSGQPGAVSVNGKELSVACGAGSLVIDKLKPAGKQEMTAEAFLAGYRHKL